MKDQEELKKLTHWKNTFLNNQTDKYLLCVRVCHAAV